MRRSLSRKRNGDGAGRLDPVAARLLAEAGQAMRQRQVGVASQALTRALELAPQCTEAWRMMGLLRHMSGHHAEAIVHLRRAAELTPADAANHMALGIALHDHGDSDEAVVAFRRACTLAPEVAAFWFNLGKSLKLRDHDTVEAGEVLARAVALDPEHMPARLTLADVRTSLGDIDAAIVQYREVLRRQPAHHRAWLGWANIQLGTFTADDLARLQVAAGQANPDSEAGIMLGFALSRALEAQGDYGAAFKVLSAANAAQHRTVGWTGAVEHARLRTIAQAFAQPMRHVSDQERGRETIFVVSLPRAGSSLVEQILASHSQVEGAGEILDLQQVVDAESARVGEAFPYWAGAMQESDWARLGKEYLQRTAHWRQDKVRVTDKNLLNWQFVGAALSMLPGARFVNVRRDPLETCLACYRQLFRTGNGFSYDLADMVAWWKQYDRLCRHWQQAYPQRFFDFNYESLLAQPEQEVRRLLDFCGLDFEPDCLQFHRSQRVVRTASAAQVRQPLKRSTARADLYGDVLNPLRLLMADADTDADQA